MDEDAHRGAAGLYPTVRRRPDLSRQTAGQLGSGSRHSDFDLEVENNEEQGYLWHSRYPLADGAKLWTASST